MTFVLNTVKRIKVYASDDLAQIPPGGAKFANEREFAAIAQDWPIHRLVEIWNKLQDVKPVRRFRDRQTAVHRIWEAAQKIEPSKAERMVAALTHPTGASLQALMQISGWQAHSVRGFISRQLSKRIGSEIESFQRDGQRVYRMTQRPAPRKRRAKE